MESILSTEKNICYACGRFVRHPHLHHIFFGKNRKISDKEGLTCYLCENCHKGTYGVHGREGHDLDVQLKEDAQEAWELKFKESYPYENHADEAAREAFIQLLGKNYL